MNVLGQCSGLETESEEESLEVIETCLYLTTVWVTSTSHRAFLRSSRTLVAHASRSNVELRSLLE